jgi:uncharacterized protein YjbI with pentapeptide repeats
MGAASYLGPTTAAHAQESVSCGTAAATWTSQEAWVWRQLCLGEIADLDSVTRFGDRGEPTDTAAWSGGRVVSSRFLETILVEEEYSRLLSDRPVHIAGAWFREEVDLSESNFPFSLYFSNSRFDKSFDLTGTDIGGSIGFWASAVKNTLDLNSVRVAGFVNLRSKGSFQDVDLIAADVKSNVQADGSTFHKKLDLNGAHVGGMVLLTNASFQEVGFTGADVKSHVQADGSTFHKKLDLNGAHVGGSVFLKNASFQDVDLITANIAGNVEADGSTFNKKLVLSGAHVGGFVFLRNKAIFQDVDLIAADIEGDIDAYGSTFHKKLSFNVSNVSGSVFLYSSSFHDIELVGANIGGRLDLSGSYFDGNVYLSNAKVVGLLALGFEGGPAHWSDGSVLDLRATSVLGIDDVENAWPNHLYLTGFTYQLPSGSTTRAGHSLADRNMSWYEHWLESDQSYSRQPYKQVETILRSVGRDRDADVIAMKSIDRQYDDRNPIFKVTGGLHRSTVGYGYRPEWIIPWALALVLVGGIVANWLPKSVTMKVSSRFMLSAQHLIPFINFGKTYADADVTSPEVRPWVRRYFYFHSSMGWVLAGLLVAALARITATANG